ncbi:MAG TPA: TetR/AcrR family transcriptional regulator [Polyangiaceae bacterium]|jgi:AcrR family transcriptional regulator|nr:TetR/AcrR family transcriptional regulator [Polyangiaceae bacterium]
MRIARAAQELFERDGYDLATIDAIARAAGTAKGTVFVHAKDKLDLLMLVMKDKLGATVERALASRPRKAGLLKQLLHVFGALFEMYREHPRLAVPFLTQTFSARGPNTDSLNILTFSFLAQLAGVIQEAQHKHQIDPDIDAMLLASNLFASYWLILIGWSGSHLSWEQAGARLESACALQLRGLLR